VGVSANGLGVNANAVVGFAEAVGEMHPRGGCECRSGE